MTEQEITTTPEVTEAVAAAPIQPKAKKAKKPAAQKPAKKIVAKKGKESTPQTDEQKRLAKNAALREWRKKNADKFNTYMKTWRENKKKEAAKATGAKKSAAKKGGARE